MPTNENKKKTNKKPQKKEIKGNQPLKKTVNNNITGKTKKSSSSNRKRSTSSNSKQKTNPSIPKEKPKKTIQPKETTYEEFDNTSLKKETSKKKNLSTKKTENSLKEKKQVSKNNKSSSKKKKKELKTKKRKLKTKYQKLIYAIFLLLFTSIFLFSTYKLLFFKKELGDIVEEKENIIEEFVEPPEIYEEVQEEEKIEDMKIDFAKLKQTNKDIVGWMVFNNKYINNPLVQTTDNEYYLNHSFKNKENSVGAIFMDYRNTSWEDKNVVLFGHHTPNNTMFGSLSDVFKKDFFETENADIIYIFDTNHHLRKYQIFSYYVIESEEYYITTTFKTTEEYNTFLKIMKSRSFKNLGIPISTKDKILTLSTCAGPHGTTKRRVIHAKLIA